MSADTVNVSTCAHGIDQRMGCSQCWADAVKADAALAASPSVGGWEDISTAPKDSTEVLVLAGRKVIRLGWYFKPSSRTEGWCDENGKRIYPTHWMPLPPPPSVSTGSRPQEAVPTEGREAAVVGDDGWTEWKGGGNPVPGEVVEARFTGGFVSEALDSESFGWDRHNDPVIAPMYDIVAYRILPQTEKGS